MKRELTVFYTDDDQEDLEFFREIMDIIDDSVIVHTQNTGEQLLNLLNNPPPTPHLIFLDINMPGMNGFEILKLVRKIENHEQLPVVMFSTSDDEVAIQKSRELGANYYVKKSSVFDQLKKSIEHALQMNWGAFIPNDKNFVYNLS